MASSPKDVESYFLTSSVVGIAIALICLMMYGCTVRKYYSPLLLLLSRGRLVGLVSSGIRLVEALLLSLQLRSRGW